MRKDYFMGLWDRPRLQFSIAGKEAPKGNWQIDPETGKLQGQAVAGEDRIITIEVSDQFGRSDQRDLIIKAKR